MPVKKDPNGRRTVGAEVEVPGTPEEVWQAIASGPGISSWFVPTKLEAREGGKIEANFGPNMDSLSTITAWDPPRRFAADSPKDMGPNSPDVATEWTVEAREGGTCVVRVVHSWFASTDDWDEQYGQHEKGWNEFFRILRLYLTHFRGQHGTIVQLAAMLPEPKEAAWSKLTNALGFQTPRLGGQLRTSGDAPKLDAVIEHMDEKYPEMLLLRLREPAPGYAHVFAMPLGGMVLLPMRLFLFGERAAEIAARDEPAWQAWFQALPSRST